MSVNTLHIDLPPEDSPSLVPWILVLTCIAILLVQISQLSTRIPTTLLQEAQKRLDTTQFPDIQLSATGRDIQVSGRVTIDQSITKLMSSLEQIDGVRHVNETLQIVDPTIEAKAQLALFEQTLATIDTTRVAFQPGSTSFTPESDSALAQLLSLLKQHPESRVRIEGHTDNTGPDTVNLRVSRDRASAVANYLMARGIPSDQLIVTGYGSTQPIADNDTENGRSRNRRIEINPVN
ncbi:MAG: OmpA family protein [Granulosicoccus sp.]